VALKLNQTLLGIASNPLLDGGPHSFTGTTRNFVAPGEPTVPVRRRVRLHDQPTGRPLREVWSSTAGVYVFDKIRAGTYYVTAFDHTGQYGGAIETGIVVPGP